MADSATHWQLALNDDGGFPKLPGDDEGVLRINWGDCIIFTLPCGSTPTLHGDPTLVVHDELAVKTEVAGKCDGHIGDWRAEWIPTRPGPCEVFLRYMNAAGTEVAGPKARLVVDPGLCINGEPLPTRSIVQLTVLSRCGGPIERWPEMLAPQGALGYNMVHFTPIQPPGESGSCYALDDQNQIDASLMESAPGSHAECLAAVKSSVDKLEKEHGMLSAMDIVLNHTAGSAPWLLEQPDCAYNLSNCPHLTAAAELDEKLGWYSEELRNGRLGGPHINNGDDVNRVINGIWDHVLKPLNLREFFLIDSEACVADFNRSSGTFEGDNYEAVKNASLPTIGVRRGFVTVPGEATRRWCRDAEALRRMLRRLQDELHKIFDSVEHDIADALRGLITYERLEIRNGPVGDGALQLCPRYFRRLQLAPDACKRLGKDTEVVVHNGWVMGWPATEDFADPTWRFVFLRRHLCAWGDCVKLRYGASPEDAPYLWKHMTNYATSMAKIFHAIRLDNAHSTPLHVSQHILAQVRKERPHCWIFAELFTGDFQTDLLYQRTLGINALIREAMQSDSVHDIGCKLTSNLWGGHPLGAISPVPTLDRQLWPAPSTRAPLERNTSGALIAAHCLPLRPRQCPALLFDCTHDNQTPGQKRHPRDALPNAALVSASCASIGSVRGYDELLPDNPSVVFERRLYADIAGVSPMEVGWPSIGIAENKDSANSSPNPRLCKIVWPHGAQSSVCAVGAWDDWKAEVQLKKVSDSCWETTLDVPTSRQPAEFKFIVDGRWTWDDRQPTSSDPYGGKNNIVNADCNGNSHGATVPSVSGPDAVENKLPGMLTVKQVLNSLHQQLGREGFVEIGVQHLSADILAVQRRAPDTGRTTWFITRSAFYRGELHEGLPEGLPVVEISGSIARLHVAATLFVSSEHESKYRKNDKVIRGLECFLQMNSKIDEVASTWRQNDKTMLQLKNFPPGSVLVFSTDPCDEMVRHDKVMALLTTDELMPAFQGLSLSELNHLLFSCEAEEQDRSNGLRGAYDIPGYGGLVYCGLMGVCAVLDSSRNCSVDLLGNSVIQNVREGDWLFDYLASRLLDMPNLERIHGWMVKVGAIIRQFPRHLVPFYFDLVVSGLCSAACNELLHGSGDFVSKRAQSSPLLRNLVVASAQFWGATHNAPLHWDRAAKEGWHKVPSLSAGLPHFSSGFMRNWGRDTFIALRGCLLVTRRFAEARETLMVYASVVRHGLCPNLLDAANNPRYNARDATWFFLQGIQDYVEMAPEGLLFLDAPMQLKWPVSQWDGSLQHLEPRTIADLIHLVLSAHAKGICFREWNAGPKIDEHMTDEGFDISVFLDEGTGIIYGGNAANCGTWMDKMGSSAKAGNKGSPATPRDGAPVEIIGLLKSTLRWVCSLPTAVFPHTAVKTRGGQDLTYKEWDKRLKNSFETTYWVGEDERIPSRTRNIYKDTVGATRNWQDFQLRPNFCIAMAVAPELFTPKYAKKALDVVADKIIGPLGMCTLDPSEPEYRGDYHNDDDSGDKAVAHGWNYHQGPEWVWPLGFFLQAWHRFGSCTQDGSAPTTEAAHCSRKVMQWLSKHRTMLEESAWRSLPELTNSKGSVCWHSCPAQAWSIATLLDALHTVDSCTAN